MSKTKTKAKTRRRMAKPKQPAQTRKMYVGPTIPGFAIQNRVYSDIPETALSKIREVPELINLFVDITEYPKANKMLREGAGYIYSAYLKALTLKK